MAENYIVTAADRERLCARMTAIGGTHLLPLINALASVAVLILSAGKLRFDAPKRGTWVCLIGDDMFTAQGPAAFHLKSLRKLLERVSAVFIMSGAVVREAYEAAADNAEAGCNVIIIETRAEEEASWTDFVRRHAPKLALTIAKPTQRKAA